MMARQAVCAFTNVHSGNLLLVNARHPLAEDYQPHQSLVPALAAGQRDVLLQAGASRMLEFCIAACGLESRVKAVSGYRTGQKQTEIYAGSLRENGVEFTEKYVALPGCSEHQTGLAIDLGSTESTDFICPSLPSDGVFATLRPTAARYGFVERYPQDKTHITGIGYEPWHFRYVGWPHSAIMQSEGWVLEEYIDRLSVCTRTGNALRFASQGQGVLVYTLTPEAAQQQAAEYSTAGRLWQMSGNNVDGVVVTLWQ